MRRINLVIVILAMIAPVPGHADLLDDASAGLVMVRQVCGGISEELSHM